jgi:hypothetical protein
LAFAKTSLSLLKERDSRVRSQFPLLVKERDACEADRVRFLSLLSLLFLAYLS